MKRAVLLVSLFVGITSQVASLNAQHRISLSPLAAVARESNARDESKERLYETDKWLASDKVKHFSVSFALVLLAKVAAKEGLKFDRAASTASAVGSTLLVGFVKEVIDDLNPNNLFSLKDLAADLLGIALALLILSLTGY